MLLLLFLFKKKKNKLTGATNNTKQPIKLCSIDFIAANYNL